LYYILEESYVTNRWVSSEISTSSDTSGSENCLSHCLTHSMTFYASLCFLFTLQHLSSHHAAAAAHLLSNNLSIKNQVSRHHIYQYMPS